MKIRNNDIPLVQAFLVREAQDYRKEGADAEQWVEGIWKNIREGLASYDGSSNYLQINSISNVGLLNRSLIITPDPWSPKGMTTINLCTCGKLSCWGTISFPDGSRTGKKGVMPLFEEYMEDEFKNSQDFFEDSEEE